VRGNTITEATAGELLVSAGSGRHVRIAFAGDHAAATRMATQLKALTWVAGFSGVESQPIIRVRRNAVALAFWTSKESQPVRESALDEAQACLA